MDLFGPFLVAGRAIPTGLNPQPGDSLNVLASGVLTVQRPGLPGPDSVTANGLVDAMGTPLLAPPGWLNPGLKQLSLVGHVGNQPIQLGTGLTQMAGPPVGGELSLDANAPPSTEYEEDGWSVYIVRAAAGEQMPRLRDWVFFEDLTTAPTVVPGGIAATVLGNVIHVFWTSAGSPAGLNHLTIDPNGVIGPTTNVDPRAVEFSLVSAVVHRGAVNVFYCGNRKPPFGQGGTLGTLRRGVLNPAGAFDLYEVDGDGGNPSGTGGAILGVVGLFNSAASVGNDLHVIYQATRDRNVPGDPDGLGAVVDDLRHARVTISGPEVAGAPYIWIASTIDGTGAGPGQVPGETGGSISTLVDLAAQVHAFYFVGAITGRPTGGNDLRHAEFDWVGGAAQQRWSLETLDGAGRTFANARGQRRRRVGLGTGCLLHNGELHVFYNDMTHDNLRWGVKPQGYPWAFETIDGLTDSPGGRGRIYGPTSNRILAAPKAALSLGDQISVFYEDRDESVIRHAYRRPGLPWMTEVVDGDTAFNGRVRSPVSRPAAVLRGGFLNLIYYDDGRQRLRHAVLSR